MAPAIIYAGVKPRYATKDIRLLEMRRAKGQGRKRVGKYIAKSNYPRAEGEVKLVETMQDLP
jgi:hypothetical protein